MALEIANAMPMESHEKAADFHELATQAHRDAAARHGKENHQTGLDHCKKGVGISE
jgi:hypothetical protein